MRTGGGCGCLYACVCVCLSGVCARFFCVRILLDSILRPTAARDLRMLVCICWSSLRAQQVHHKTNEPRRGDEEGTRAEGCWDEVQISVM